MGNKVKFNGTIDLNGKKVKCKISINKEDVTDDVFILEADDGACPKCKKKGKNKKCKKCKANELEELRLAEKYDE